MGDLRRSTCRCLRSAFVVVSFCGVLVPSACAQKGLFSVRDSIEMTTFSDPYTRSPDSQCKASPNGKYFFAITTKGMLATNQLQSTIWLYRSNRVLAFLRKRNAAAPQPKLLVSIQATPRAQQFDSYGSLITKAQWSSDSAGILFLAETGDGLRRLYEVHISGREKRLVSARSEDVEDFTEAAGTSVYISEPGARSREGIHSSSFKNPVSTVLTGRSLLNIFDPSEFSPTGTANRASDLWAVHGNRRIALNQRYGLNSWHYPVSAGNAFHLALSPNGNALIAAKPVSQIRPSWRQLVSLLPSFDFARLPGTEANADRDWLWPWQYVYINLSHDQQVSLAEAPTAWMTGYGEPYQAVWSQDGRRVLVTSTFLSTSPDSIEKTAPCSVAVFTVATEETRCVAYTRYVSSGSRLRSARFGSSPDEVVIDWSTRGKPNDEVYRLTDGNWLLASTANVEPRRGARLSVSIRQGLDKPPALWATDHESGVNKELWNPNPQLGMIGMGQTSIYRWKDSSGYEWEAGLVKPYGYIPGRRYPLVVQTHGFSPHEFLVDGSYTTGFAAQPLAAAGIMVLQMEDRSDRHQKGIGQEANLFAQGCAAGIQQLDADGLIDPARVGIIGFSRTSWYVETTSVNFPKLFKAAAIIDGVDQGYVNYILFCAGMPSCRNEPELANGGAPFGQALESWLHSAASFRLDRVQAPLRIEAINWYSILQEWEIYSSLFQQEKPVDFVYIANGQHILQQPKQRFVSQQGNVDWFRFWLQGFEDPSPLKRAQYRRWTKLKNSTGISRSGVETTENAKDGLRAW
jgi:hypothetical protein